MRPLAIAYGNNRQAKTWTNKTITFDELKERLKVTIRTPESAEEYVCPYDFNHTWAQICDKRGEKFIFDGNWGSGEQYYETIFPKYCGCKFHGKYGRPFRYG